jgi:hypothetical protein
MRVLSIIIAVLFISACSDETVKSGDSYAEFTSGITQSLIVSSSPTGKIEISDSYADSLEITDFKVLISRIMLHSGAVVSNDTVFNDNTGLLFKSGAIVVKSDSVDRESVFAEAFIKEGYYNKVKIEMHRLTPNVLNQYVNNLDFADFITPDRNTIAIRGRYYQNGEWKDFEYFSKIVMNFTFNLNPPIEFVGSDNYEFVFEFNPAELLIDSNGKIIIPSEQARPKMENRLRSSLRLKQKQA